MGFSDLYIYYTNTSYIFPDPICVLEKDIKDDFNFSFKLKDDISIRKGRLWKDRLREKT